MPEDRLQQFFEQIAEMPVDLPPAERVLARGQQRRRRARLQASAVAGTIMVAAGVGAPQLPGSLAVSTGQVRPMHALSAPHDPYLSFGVDSSPTPSGSTPTRQPSRPAVIPGPSGQNQAAAPLLPPPGGGKLILGLDSAHRYVMTRVGAASAPIRVRGLNAVPGTPAVLATNPAGGWVVTLSSTRSTKRSGPVRLAVVATTGRSVPFGPEFTQVSVTSGAVSLDGTRVAVAVAGQSGPARIEVLPLPGHRGSLRSWTVPTAHADLVTGLSWAPDGRRLGYLATQRTATGSASSPGILDTARLATARPTITPWPPAMNTGAMCVPEAMAWLGRSGRYAVLEACARARTAVLQTTVAGTGTPAGQPLVVAHRVGCGAASLDPSASGGSVLISYCGLYLDDHGKLTKAPAGLTAAALSG
jgi:hypothetical protein